VLQPDYGLSILLLAKLDRLYMLNEIENHLFITELFNDADKYFSNRKYSTYDIELKENEFDELEYYVHKVGFYTMYLITLCKQLSYVSATI
jgi:hypothetical protein